MDLSTEKNKKEQEQRQSPVVLKKMEGEKKNEEGGADNGGGRSCLILPSNPSQLTIFYNGSVSVFDSTPEKAQAILLFAAASAAAAKVGSPVLTRSQSSQSSTAANAYPTSKPQPKTQPHLIPNGNSLCKLQAELPIARRNSLQRFLEKRRDRLVNKNPYSVKKPEAPGSSSPVDESSTPLNGYNEIVKSN